MKTHRTILLTLFFGALGWGQTGTMPKALIPVLVKDSHSQVVPNLTAESLVISDQKTRVANFSLLHSTEVPLDLGILIDTSKSQRYTTLPDALRAAKDFVSTMVRLGDDRVFFMTFSDKPEATRWLKKEDLAGLSVAVKISGATALYDSIAIACKERMEPPNGRQWSRRMLVVISDGEDNSSKITLTWAESEALKAGVVIFSVSTQESPIHASRRATRALDELATATGGELFTGLGRTDMVKAFATIKELADGMYYASYFPPNAGDHVHQVDIRPSSKAKFEISYPKKYVWIQ